MLEGLIKILRGLVLNPVLVAGARGALEMVVMAAILVVTDSATNGDIRSTYPVLAPFLVYVLRQAEGLADKIDPVKQRRRDLLRESPVTDEDGNPFSGADLGEPA